MNSEEEVELVKLFMLRISPEIARTSLRSDTSVQDNAEHTLCWSMHLTAKFSAFKNEALKAINKKDPASERE